ncbi:ribosomal protein L6e-domain-containing protein [Hyaloraphidium curvatum]|nr:ribosomal protein L6e-domain-containing protein [Hyaloraphidium curvatum]
MVHAPRNSWLKPGVARLSRSESYRARGVYKKKKEVAAKKDEVAGAATVTKEVGGAKNGGKREVLKAKGPRFYPADDVARPKRSRKTSKPTKLRSSITPGTVVIILAGRFRGKRVVFLKQLPSGLLLVTGPHKANGVPLRRVNQSYVIATSTKIDVSNVEVPEHIDDAYFKADKKAKKQATEEELFDKDAPKKSLDPKRAADQKAIDGQLQRAIAAVPLLKSYLSSRFSLKNGDVPHLLKF